MGSCKSRIGCESLARRLGCASYHPGVSRKVEIGIVDVGREQADGGNRSAGDKGRCIRNQGRDSYGDTVRDDYIL